MDHLLCLFDLLDWKMSPCRMWDMLLDDVSILEPQIAMRLKAWWHRDLQNLAGDLIFCNDRLCDIAMNKQRRLLSATGAYREFDEVLCRPTNCRITDMRCMRLPCHWLWMI